MKLSKKQRIGAIGCTIILWWIMLIYPVDKCNAPHEVSIPISWNAVKNAETVPSCWTGDDLEQCALPPTSPKNISREEAKKLILSGKVKRVFQAHNLEVHLATEEWMVITEESVIDEVFRLVESCWTKCSNITLATE